MKKNISGFGLVEVIIVIMIFLVISLLATSSIFITLRGTEKSQSTLKVRESLNYALSIIQRQLRGAEEIQECPLSDPSEVSYYDSEGELSTFICQDIGENGYIASGSARLSSENISVTICSFTCSEGSAGSRPNINLEISAEDKEVDGLGKGKASFSTNITLRSY